MKSLTVLIITFVITCFGGLTTAQDKPVEPPVEPPQVISIVPEGWIDEGPYYWGENPNGTLIIHFRLVEITKNKLDIIRFGRDASVDKNRQPLYPDGKNWNLLAAGYIEQVVRDVMKDKGILDWAATVQEIAFAKKKDFYWDECPKAVNEWIQANRDVMCSLQDRVMKIIKKAFLKE